MKTRDLIAGSDLRPSARSAVIMVRHSRLAS